MNEVVEVIPKTVEGEPCPHCHRVAYKFEASGLCWRCYSPSTFTPLTAAD